MVRIMRPFMFAAILIVGLSGGALAQNSVDQPRGNTNTKQGTAGQQAPVGHRQPTLKTLPPDVLQHEQAPPPGYNAFGKTPNICKGC